MARQLEENGIKLRAPEPEDLDCMFRFENIVDLWDISNTTGPYSRFHLKQYIEQTQNDLFTDLNGISVIPQDLTPVSI